MDLPRIGKNRFHVIGALALFTLFVMSASVRAQSTPDLPTLFHYDGSTAITLSNLSSLSPTDQITIMAWIKPDFNTQDRGSSNVDTVIEKRDGCGSNRSYDFGVYQPPAFPDAPGTIFFSASVAGDDMYSNVPVPNDGHFHHIAGVYDGSSEKIFLDGALVGQVAHSGLIPTTSDPPIIGSDRCGHPSYADIDQIKLFSRALSDQEILAASAGNGGSGTVTQVNTGAGLTGGPITTSGTISIATAAVTNAMLANSGLTVNSGSGLSGGGAVALGGALTLTLDTSVTDGRYLRLTGGTLTGGLSTPTLNTGTATIGGGDTITKHMSHAFGLTVPILSASTCSYTNYALPGVSDGDTLALGVSNSLTQAGSGILNYSAWVGGPGLISFRICNLNPNGPKSTSVTGTVRVDIWKH